MTNLDPSPALTAEAASSARNASAAAASARPFSRIAAVTVRPTKLDQLAAEGIASAVARDGSGNMRDYHGLALLGLAAELLEYSPSRAASSFGQANSQKLFGALLAYQQHFAPDEHWKLVEEDPETATLVWRCQSTDLPDVVDVITRTSRLAATSHDDMHVPHDLAECAVVRECDLINPKGSRLTFTGEPGPVTWCPADDPIRMRELAFPFTISTSAGRVRDGHLSGGQGLAGLALIADDETGFVTAASKRSTR